MTDIDISDKVGFSVDLNAPTRSSLSEGFNEYGVRENTSENEDGEEYVDSIDVIFEAMEPGVHKGIEISGEFLQFVASNSEPGFPAMLDHSSSQLAKVGSVTDVKFSDGKLRLMANIPNTGSSVKSDVIADFTHDPPDITDGSIGLNRNSIEFADPEGDNAKARFAEATLKEFSFTPFPAGYEDGGLSPVFNEDGKMVTRDWGEGDVVEYQSVPGLIGAVSHIDKSRLVAMVGLHNEVGSDLVPTGDTVTAGMDDLILYEGDATPVDPEEMESESEYSEDNEESDSLLVVNDSQLAVSDK